MPDPIFESPRLVAIYDLLDGPRGDLATYIAIAQALRAKSILDIGCGTGTFALLASQFGFQVTGLEPALASLNFARQKSNADRVNWILGETSTLPSMTVDLAIMTGNVAQVFTTDEVWESNLLAIRKVLMSNGHLVFEVRDPADRPWLNWTRAKTHRRINIPELDQVECWCDVTSTESELVSFRWTYVFESDGAVIHSDSTIRFRERSAIETSLKKCGYRVLEVRDAPNRANQEFVFIAGLS